MAGISSRRLTSFHIPVANIAIESSDQEVAAGVAHLYCSDTLRMTNVGLHLAGMRVPDLALTVHRWREQQVTRAGEEFQALHSLRLAGHFKVEIIRMVLNHAVRN